MIKKILIAVVIIIAAAAVYIAMQPSHFNVSRSVMVEGKPADIFSHVNNFHKWEAWSPWVKEGDEVVNSFEGPESGVGAMMKWEGNKGTDVGSMKIVHEMAHEAIKIDLEMMKPYMSHDVIEFAFKHEGKETMVTWTISGDRNFTGKAIAVLMNCDKMIGQKFDEGLMNLKKVVEESHVKKAEAKKSEAKK